jgi:hypothetical protein
MARVATGTSLQLRIMLKNASQLNCQSINFPTSAARFWQINVPASLPLDASLRIPRGDEGKSKGRSEGGPRLSWTPTRFALAACRPSFLLFQPPILPASTVRSALPPASPHIVPSHSSTTPSWTSTPRQTLSTFAPFAFVELDICGPTSDSFSSPQVISVNSGVPLHILVDISPVALTTNIHIHPSLPLISLSPRRNLHNSARTWTSSISSHSL